MEPDILEYAADMNCQELHMVVDKSTDLKAIIAIHSTLMGPALGGCRCIEYPGTLDAVIDAIRLAQGMTYKAAIANLPLGGGKMVLLKPKNIQDRIAYFRSVGRFVNTLNGRYITAVDSGTSVEDMDIIATETLFVTSTTESDFSVSDPSVMTANGIVRGIEAALQFKFGNSSLKGIHVAIQGLGHAGYNLAKRLYAAGAKLTVYDVKEELVERGVNEFNAKRVSNLEALLALESDVFAPCALGAVLDDHSISLLKAPIVAGSANNQLAEPRHGQTLQDRGILYVPDYVINAGGLIYVAAEYHQISERESLEKINGLYDTLIEIFKRSEKEKKTPDEIADTIAKERLNKRQEVING